MILTFAFTIKNVRKGALNYISEDYRHILVPEWKLSHWFSQKTTETSNWLDSVVSEFITLTRLVLEKKEKPPLWTTNTTIHWAAKLWHSLGGPRCPSITLWATERRASRCFLHFTVLPGSWHLRWACNIFWWKKWLYCHIVTWQRLF